MFASPVRICFSQIDSPLRKNAHIAGNVIKFRINNQFGTDAAAAQFRTGEIQIIAALENMIGELVSCSHSDSPGRSIACDQVDSSHLGFFSAVFGIARE